MGYFSSIAKQSGVRIAGASAAAPAPVVRVAGPEPLEVEETVIVSPPVEAGVPRAADPPPRTPAEAVSERAAPDLPAVATTRLTPPAASTVPAPAIAPAAAPEPAAADGAKVPPPLEANPTETTIGPLGVFPATAEPPPLLIVERSRSVGSQEPTIVDEHSTPAPVIASTRVPEAPAAPRYFARTAALVSGRDADPAMLQTVVFRDVQEWVAASPGTRWNAAVAESATAPEVIRADEEPPASPPEPGTVRIGAGSRVNRAATATAPPLTEIEERFELSIGTISVVVEGDQALAPPAAAPLHAGRERRPNPPPRSSRLSRHYL